MSRMQTSLNLRDYLRRHRNNPRITQFLQAQGITPDTAPRRTRPKPGEQAEQALYASLRQRGIPHTEQYPWGAELTPKRKYTADARIHDHPLLVEVIGNAHAAGHKKLARDTERHRLATLAGWVILPVTPDQALDGSAGEIVASFLKLKKTGAS